MGKHSSGDSRESGNPKFQIPNLNMLWNRIVAWLDAASRQHHIVALRDGMIAAVPIILVGSTFLLLGSQGDVLKNYFPTIAASSFGEWYMAHTALIFIPYRLTMGMLSLYIAFTIAAALARQYSLPPVPQGLGAVACLLLATTQPAKIAYPTAADKPVWTIALGPVGADGLFVAILLGVAMVEVSRFILRPGRAPEKKAESSGAIPQAVLDAFASFGPILLMVTLCWTLTSVFGVSLVNAVNTAAAPIKSMGDSLGAVISVNILLHLFGVAGVHGISVINSVMLPIWQQYLAANADAHAAGQAAPYVTAFPFYQWFVWMGGQGVTLAPTVLLLFSRHPHLKKIGRISIIPAFFNINEPLLFGLPVVANPILAIPFILTPLVCGVTAFLAVNAGLVARPFIEVPWVLPCFLGGVLATGNDPRAFVLVAVNLAISAAIWYPFLRYYARELT